MDLGGHMRDDGRGRKTKGEGRGKMKERGIKAIRGNKRGVSRRELDRQSTGELGGGDRRQHRS